MYKGSAKKRGVWYVIAEAPGVIALLAIMVLYLAAMGGYWISGVGVFLMPITITGYLLLTWQSQKRSTVKGYWIMYAARFTFMIGLFLLSPVISDVMARLVNG